MVSPRTAKARTIEVARRLETLYPEAICELDHRNPFELLVATILSAQCTDARVNMVTPALFARYPDAGALAAANQEEVEVLVRSTGSYRVKARNLIGMASALIERFGAEVPTDLDDLVSLPGVGRKTGNVVRAVCFGLEGLPVDTHVGRLTHKLALSEEVDPTKIEFTLGSYLPAEQWGPFGLRLILHGRRICDAKRPACGTCALEDICPSSQLPRVVGRTNTPR